MRPLIDGWSIVIIGIWNYRIFNPEWIKKNILDDQNVINVSMALNMPSIKFDFETLSIIVSDTRLQVMPKSDDLSCLPKMQEVIVKVLKTLEHTPVSAVGVNFRFKIEEDTERFENVFRLSDNERIINMLNEKTDIIRRFSFKDFVFLLFLTISNEPFIENNLIDFNFHKDISSTHEAIDLLSHDINVFYNKANDVFDMLYKKE